MKEIHFTSIYHFFDSVQLSEKERRSQIIYSLNLDYDRAIKELNAKFQPLTEEEQSHYGKKLINVVNQLLDVVDAEKVDENKALLKFKAKLSNYAYVPDMKNYPNIFRSRQAYEFFINTLIEYDIINERYNIIGKPKQNLLNGILKNDLYKEHIFNYRVGLGKYVDYFNETFNTKLNREKLSDSDRNFDKELTRYITTHFLPT